MKYLLSILTVTTLLAAAAPAYALQGAAIGYGGGISLEGQWDSNWAFRAEPWGPYTEATLQLIGRSQAIAPAGTYAIDATGIGVCLGGRSPWVYGGLMAELDSIRTLATVPNSQNLAYNYRPGFIVAPYLGVVLPFLNTDFTELDLDLTYPLYAADPAFGPRLNLTLWIGGLGKDETGGKAKKPTPKATPKTGPDDEDEIRPSKAEVPVSPI